MAHGGRRARDRARGRGRGRPRRRSRPPSRTGAGKQLFDDVRDRIRCARGSGGREASRVADEERTECHPPAHVLVVTHHRDRAPDHRPRRALHPALGHPPDRRARHRRAAACGTGDLDAPIRVDRARPRSPSWPRPIDSMRTRIDAQPRRRGTCPRGGRAERRASCWRCARSSNPTSASCPRAGRSPPSSGPPKVWSPATATTSRRSRGGSPRRRGRRHRRPRQQPRGSSRSAARSCSRASLAAGVEPGDGDRRDRAAAGRHGRRRCSSPRSSRSSTPTTGRSGTRTPATRRPTCAATTATSSSGPTGPLVGLLGDEQWGTGDASMTTGDNLCAYTDGLIEVRNTAPGVLRRRAPA